MPAYWPSIVAKMSDGERAVHELAEIAFHASQPGMSYSSLGGEQQARWVAVVDSLVSAIAERGVQETRTHIDAFFDAQGKRLAAARAERQRRQQELQSALERPRRIPQ